MKPRTDDELFPEPSEARSRIYAWEFVNPPAGYEDQLKVGQTTRSDVNIRIRQSMGQAQQPYTLRVDEIAETAVGETFSDTDVRQRLVEKGFENVAHGSSREWMRCTHADVLTAIEELRAGVTIRGTHHLTYGPRQEQRDAVNQTYTHFENVWAEGLGQAPRFLWNAKMRFGKTFSAYQLALRMRAKRVLVVTFKPAVEQSWADDLRNHMDFEDWEYLNAKTAQGRDVDPTDVPADTPLVYFGSLQDLLGRDRATQTIKAKNRWIHDIAWDLVIFDEYHFGAWRDGAKALFEHWRKEDDEIEVAAEERALASVEAKMSSALALDERVGVDGDSDQGERPGDEADFLPIESRAYLYLSGTPFRALAGEFADHEIFNWTYTDEQKRKTEWPQRHPGKPNPYAALPEMCLMTYQMPDEIVAVASQGELDEFDLNTFFGADGRGAEAEFRHPSDVQKWLDIIRGDYLPLNVDLLKVGSRPPFPYSDHRLLKYLRHSIWFLPDVASVHAMANLLESEANVAAWGQYSVLRVAGEEAGIGVEALDPVRRAIGSGHDTQTITLTCGKLTTGVTVPQWSSILMLRNLRSPETYFQAAFRVQSSWAIDNPEGDDPKAQAILKPMCYVFDFAPTRALRQVTTYGTRLSPNTPNQDHAVAQLLNYLPVLAYKNGRMQQLDAGAVIDIAMIGTSASLLAQMFQSAMLVNLDLTTLKRIQGTPDLLAAIMRIEGFRSLPANVIETIINQAEKVNELKGKARESGGSLSGKDRKELDEAEKERKSLRTQVKEKLIKFATRIPVFMYLTDAREHTLEDVITKIEPDLFKTVTGLSVADFAMLRTAGVFNENHMNDVILSFRRAEEASLSYTGIERHPGLRRWGLFNTVVELGERDEEVEEAS